MLYPEEVLLSYTSQVFQNLLIHQKPDPTERADFADFAKPPKTLTILQDSRFVSGVLHQPKRRDRRIVAVIVII